MADSPDSAVIGVRCPKCGNLDERAPSWLREHAQMFCPSCGARIAINQEKLTTFLGKPEGEAPSLAAPKAASKLSNRVNAIVVAILFIGLGSLAVGLLSSSEIAPTPQRRPTLEPSVPTCANPPANGAALFFGLPLINNRGDHRLTIKNGSAGNAIVVLRMVRTNEFVGEFFVAKNDTAVIGGLADGTYRVAWAIGELLAVDCRRFAQTESASEFDDAMDMRTRYSDGYVYTADNRLTLYTVPGGKAGSHAVKVEDFYPP